jgi:hypothetical protein
MKTVYYQHESSVVYRVESINKTLSSLRTKRSDVIEGVYFYLN